MIWVVRRPVATDDHHSPFCFWLGELSAFAFEFDARSQLSYGDDTNGKGRLCSSRSGEQVSRRIEEAIATTQGIAK